MIRLSLRQLRIQAVSAFAALGVVAVAAVLTGPHLVDLYNTTVASCKPPTDCSLAAKDFLANDSLLQIVLTGLLLALPALLGIFWGAPLIARELETGTFRLVLTQSVTRRRWMVMKLGIAFLFGVVGAAALSMIVTAWFGPIDKVAMNQFAPGVFDSRNVVEVGYAVFALALGVTAGILTRRTVPAMAITLVLFAAAHVAMTIWVRPLLMAPDQANMPLASSSGLGFEPGASGITLVADAPNIPNALVISSRIVDASGQDATSQGLHQFLVNDCPDIIAQANPPSGVSRGPADPVVFQNCIAKLAGQYHLVVTNQPADRYWTFQWYESAIFVGLAAFLVGLSLWWVGRRVV
jgi:hypothetical protein